MRARALSVEHTARIRTHLVDFGARVEALWESVLANLPCACCAVSIVLQPAEGEAAFGVAVLKEPLAQVGRLPVLAGVRVAVVATPGALEVPIHCIAVQVE